VREPLSQIAFYYAIISLVALTETACGRKSGTESAIDNAQVAAARASAGVSAAASVSFNSGSAPATLRVKGDPKSPATTQP
jgi:hypothetical protein